MAVPPWRRQTTPQSTGHDAAGYAHGARPPAKGRDTFRNMRSVEVNVTPAPGLELPSYPGAPDPSRDATTKPGTRQREPNETPTLKPTTDPGLGPVSAPAPEDSAPSDGQAPPITTSEIPMDPVLVNREPSARFRQLIERLDGVEPQPRRRRAPLMGIFVALAGVCVVLVGAVVAMRAPTSREREQPTPPPHASRTESAASATTSAYVQPSVTSAPPPLASTPVMVSAPSSPSKPPVATAPPTRRAAAPPPPTATAARSASTASSAAPGVPEPSTIDLLKGH